MILKKNIENTPIISKINTLKKKWKNHHLQKEKLLKMIYY